MAKSGIYIKPSKRGTFTSAAKKRGKTVQGFASTVLANKENYSSAMVKKANFARNAAKWKKEVGGYLDQQLNEIPIQDTPIESEPVPQTQFGCGGRLRRHQDGGQLDFAADAAAMGHTVQEHVDHVFQDGGNLEGGTPESPWQGTFGNKGDFGQIQLNTGALAERHEDLKNLKYLDLPDTDWGSLVSNIGGAALSAYSGAGGSFGAGSSGVFDIASTGAGQGIEALGASQLGGSGSGSLVSSLSGVLGSGAGGDNALSGLFGTNEDGGYLNQYEDGGQLSQQNAREKFEITQEEYDAMLGGLSQEQTEGSYPIYQEGGQLLGYLPEHGFGSWLGDNAGKILKGVGGVVSVIPGFGTVVGPILIGAGYATDAIVGAVRKKRAEGELAEATKREEEAAAKRAQAGLLSRQFDPSENVDYGATFQLGGGLMQGQVENPTPEASTFPSDSENPVIVGYNGNSNTHQQGVGGVPVDAKGNPSAVSKQSAVGLTEKGEVTWNGYVFSDKLTT
jgi:hypothetical protein